MRKTLIAVFAVSVGALLATPAQAAQVGVPVVSDCLKGFYVNPDEALLLPEQKVDGLLFEGKDLIHHATDPIDFADFDKTTKGFQATKPGKVVFKAETSGPYSNLVINDDGKVWSTAFKPEAVGGQNLPVAKAADLIGKPESMKPGKDPYTSASRVVTFGVGYWAEAGDTVVTSISFHGTVYDLSCKPKPEPTKTSVSPSASASSSVSASPSVSTTAGPTASSTSSPIVDAGNPGDTGSGTNLPVTGPAAPIIVGAGLLLMIAGAITAVAVRRRRTSFTA